MPLLRSFYFLRHGETDWNKIHRIQGSTDIPLNETGRAQAKAARESLLSLDIHHVVASPLKRAYETAEIVNEVLKRPLSADAGLQERDYGVFEGALSDEYRVWQQQAMKSACPTTFEENGYPCPERAESYTAFKSRITGAVNAHLEKAPGQNVLFVAHGGVYRVLMRMLLETVNQSPNAKPFLFEKNGALWSLKEI